MRSSHISPLASPHHLLNPIEAPMSSRFTTIATGLILLIIGGLFMLGGDNPAKEKVDSASIDQSPTTSKHGSQRSRRMLTERRGHGPTIAELIERFGEKRVEQAQVALPHFFSSNKGSFHTVDSIFSDQHIAFLMSEKLMMNSFGVSINEDQKLEIVEICHKFALRELAIFEQSLRNVEENPERLLEVILTSDARSRDEISEEQYQSYQHKQADFFGNLMHPTNSPRSLRLWEGKAIGDLQLRDEVMAIFTPEQLQIYDQKVEAHLASNHQDQRYNIALVDPIGLKTLLNTLALPSSLRRMIIRR